MTPEEVLAYFYDDASPTPGAKDGWRTAVRCPERSAASS